MLTHLSIGPATIPSYPFLALIGLWAGMWLAAREASKRGIDGDHVYNLELYGMLGGIIGGRLWYVLTHWNAYTDAPLQALALTANAISIPEGIIVALAVALIYSKRHSLPLRILADAIAPGAALTLIIGGTGAFLGSQTLGTTTSMPWGIEQFGQIRHPAHLYQAGAVVVILVAILMVGQKAKWPGFIALLFSLLYAGSRLLLDPFFAQPTLIGNGWRMVQVSALISMVLILAIMARLDYNNQIAN